MAAPPPAPPFVPVATLETWRAEQQRQEATAQISGDQARLRNVLGFGAWPIVVLDTILLFVLELALSLIVIGVAVALFVANGHHLGSSQGHPEGPRGTQTADLQSWLGTPQALAASALATQVAIVLIIQWRLVGRGIISWRELGFGPALRRQWPRALLIGGGLGLAAFVAGELMLALLHGIGLDINGQADTLKSVKHAPLLALLPFVITTVITAPLAEETFFRAYALRALSVRHGFPAGLLLSSALFGALHLAGGVGWVAVALFVVGAILGWGYARTGNLLTNITAHAINNAIGLILLYHG